MPTTNSFKPIVAAFGRCSSLAGLVVALLLLCWSQVALTAASAALGYEAKYPPGFSHFDYVNPNAPKGGDLSLSAFGSFDSLNPFVLRGLSAAGLNLLVFESLMVRSWDEPFSMYGLLADDIQLAEDGLSVTFRLHEQARFSDGSPVTAEDVKFSFDTLVSEQAHPRYRYYWSDVKSATVIDERHIRFDFYRSNPELHLIVGELPVFSRKWVNGEDFSTLTRTPPIASGPYIIEQVNFGRSIRYRRNPDYWADDLSTRRGMFNFETVTYKYYRDQTVAQEAFKAGEFDFFYETNSKRWARDHEGRRYRDGEILKAEKPHSNNAGMQGFVFNTRRPLFEDVRVRRALTLAFDFHWSNENLFYGQYERCYSYFSNSELAAVDEPSEGELALLERFRDQLPPEVFGPAWRPPQSETPRELRDNLVRARDLLKEAGWEVRDGVLRNEQGQPFRFEIMLVQRGFERIVAPYVYNLRKLGIDASYRTIDPALYQRRMDNFDFDMTVVAYRQSQSPGNELREIFGSAAADRVGSLNYAGINDPVVDALIDEIIHAPDRESLVTAARALDRVLLWGEYLVPNWYTGVHRIAWWNRFGYPQTLPLYYDATTWVIQTWWEQSDETLAAHSLEGQAK
ncbi:MAG TPA: ABC transporter substrate-binding protein [Halothiobacillus sp.]|nr:ABC transporter substrate-binding protein [Halothiobacillus sp.]